MDDPSAPQPQHPKQPHKPRIHKPAPSGWRGLPARIKRNPYVSLLLLFVSAVAGLATFSDAASDVTRFVRGFFAPDISGQWTSNVLTNPFDANEHSRLVFDFQFTARDLSGIVTEIEEDAPNKGRRFESPIVGGKSDNGSFSFHTNFQVSTDDADHSEFYEGKLAGGKLSIRRWNNLENDDGTAIERFQATRSAK